jgi:hypothetical protein
MLRIRPTVAAEEFRRTVILRLGLDRGLQQPPGAARLVDGSSTFLEHLQRVHEVRKAAREHPSSFGLRARAATGRDDGSGKGGRESEDELAVIYDRAPTVAATRLSRATSLAAPWSPMRTRKVVTCEIEQPHGCQISSWPGRYRGNPETSDHRQTVALQRAPCLHERSAIRAACGCSRRMRST